MLRFKKKFVSLDNKIKRNKVQYNLDKNIAKIQALSLGNVSKYKFLTGKDVLPEKKLARRRCYNEKIWIFTFRQRIKNTNWYCKETVSKNKIKINKTIKKEKPTLEKYRSNI